MERNARRKKTVKGAATTYIMELSSFPAKEQPVRRSKVVTYSDLEVDKPGHIMDDALRADVHESSGATTPLKGQHSKSSMIQERDDDDQHLRCQCFERMLTKYAEALETRPLIYKCMTSALVGGLGDVVAQALSWVFRGGVSRTIWHDIKVCGDLAGGVASHPTIRQVVCVFGPVSRAVLLRYLPMTHNPTQSKLCNPETSIVHETCALSRLHICVGSNQCCSSVLNTCVGVLG